MTRITPLAPDATPDLARLAEQAKASMGFVPHSVLTMAHWPELATAFRGLMGVIRSGELDPGLRQLVAFVASNAAGCRYCQAHTSHGAEHLGVSGEKIDAAFEFETSPLFGPAERAALRVAARSAMVPNAVEDADFEELARHFSEREIVEIVAVVSVFGFLNRWNDTMATTLEAPAVEFASTHLASRGWQLGKHG